MQTRQLWKRDTAEPAEASLRKVDRRVLGLRRGRKHGRPHSIGCRHCLAAAGNKSAGACARGGANAMPGVAKVVACFLRRRARHLTRCTVPAGTALLRLGRSSAGTGSAVGQGQERSTRSCSPLEGASTVSGCHSATRFLQATCSGTFVRRSAKNSTRMFRSFVYVYARGACVCMLFVDAILRRETTACSQTESHNRNARTC